MSNFYTTCFEINVDDQVDHQYSLSVSPQWLLTLAQAPLELTSKFKVSTPPLRRVATPIKLCFEVRSLEQTRELVTGAGGAVYSVTEGFVHGGFRPENVLDPEGNVVAVRGPQSFA